MIRAVRHSLALAILTTSLLPLSGCDTDTLTNLNNPFNPRAELRILDIKGSGEEGEFIGIRQSAETEGENTFTLYTYTNPVTTIELLPGYPTVNFTGFRSRVTLADGTVLPVKDYTLTKGMPEDANQIDIQFPILTQDDNIRDTVYVANNAPRVSSGSAEVELFAKDINGHSIVIPFTVPLSFSSVIYSSGNDIPELAPSASPNPNTNQG